MVPTGGGDFSGGDVSGVRTVLLFCRHLVVGYFDFIFEYIIALVTLEIPSSGEGLEVDSNRIGWGVIVFSAT